MPRSTVVRKNQTDLTAHLPAPVGLTIEHSQNVQAARRDPRQTLAALEGITHFFSAKSQERAKKLAEQNIALGIRDADLDQVNDELHRQSESYRQAVNGRRDQRESLEWFNRKREELNALQRHDPNMDFEAWRSSAVAELYGDDRDPDSLDAKSTMAGQLESNLRSLFEARRSSALVEQQTKEFAGYARAVLDGGMVKSERDIDALVRQGMQDGLEQAEARQLVARAIGNEIELGRVELYPMLQSSTSRLDLDGELGAQLEQSYQAGQRRREAERAEAKRPKGEAELVAVNAVNRLAARGAFTLEQARQYVDQLPNGFLTAALERSQGQVERQRDRAEAAAAKAAEKQQRIAAVGAAIAAGDTSVLYAQGYGVKDVQDYLDEAYGTAWTRLQQASAADDATGFQQARFDMTATIEQSRRLGLIPASFKQRMDAADPAMPEPFIASAELYAQMKAEGLDSFLSQGLRAPAVSLYEAYGRAREAGASPRDAAQALAEQTVPEQQIGQTLRRSYRQIEQAARRLAGGSSGLVGAVQSQLHPLIEAELRTGASQDTAIAQATRTWEKRYTVINGIPMRLGVAPDDIGEQFGEFVETTIAPVIGTTYGDDRTFVPIPAPNRPGYFLIAAADGIGTFLRSPEGEPYLVSYADMVAANTGRQQERAAERRQGQRNVLKMVSEAP